MAATEDSETPGPRLFGVTGRGLVPLPGPPGATDLHGLFRGVPSGIYEGLRTFGGHRFLRLEAHLDRADVSAAGAGLRRRIDRGVLRRGLDEVARDATNRGPKANLRLRFDLCGGEVELPDGSRTDLVLGVEPLPSLPRNALTDGVATRTDRELCRMRPTVKSAEWVVTRRKAIAGRETETASAYETLLLDGRGRILEGSSSNVFFARGGALLTAGAGVLPGITRGVVLDLAARLGIPVVEKLLTVDEAVASDEALLTSASRGPVPITRIDAREVGGGRPGEIWLSLRRAWAELAEREARPAWPSPS